MTTVSTHSRLKAAANAFIPNPMGYSVSTHSRLKAAGITVYALLPFSLFQHTAA